MFDICTNVHFDSHYVCLVAYGGHLCFWVTSLNRLLQALTDFIEIWFLVFS